MKILHTVPYDDNAYVYHYIVNFKAYTLTNIFLTIMSLLG